MRFSGGDGSFLELSVAGYEALGEYPKLDWDANWLESARHWLDEDPNWLVIAGHVSLAGREWRFKDPCLLTWDVAELAHWLEARSKGPSEDSEIDFMEPFVRFTWSQGALIFRSGPWTADEVEYLRFSPSSDELMAAALSLREDLRKYPPRKPWPEH